MTYASEWCAISARIRKLEALLSLYIGAQATRPSSLPPVMNPLWDNADGLQEEIGRFTERHSQIIPRQALEALNAYLGRQWHYPSSTPSYAALMEKIVAISSFESEFSYFISGHGEAAKRITERAFLHLSRSLVVDEQLRNRWATALESHETAVEKLGGVHLLHHGIWGFKIDASGERTDLVLSEPISDYGQIERSTDGLVLTEWKAFRGEGDPARLWEDAYIQAKRYAEGCLAATELLDTRYLVLVTMMHVEEPENRVHGGVTYRHINIALAPDPPSRQRRGRGKNQALPGSDRDSAQAAEASAP
jgi:hypothetical protein